MTAPLFSAGELRELQQLNEATLPHVADIFVPTTTKGTLGQVTSTFPTTPTVGGLPCRVVAQGGLARESVVAGALQTPATSYVVVFAAGTTISDKAKLRVTGSTANSAGGSAPFTLWLAVQGAPQVQAFEAMRKVLAVVTDAVAGT